MLFDIKKIILYRQDAKGGIREWSIRQEKSCIIIEHGVLNGKMQEQCEDIAIGKASRTQQQQIASRINSRINKQELKGYKHSIEEAQEGKSNILGLTKPMLAQSYQKVKDLDFETAFVQMKLDGNRCLLTKQNGVLIPYSRNGKRIETIGHITSEIKLEEGMTIDGELYAHGYTLQEIVSWIKRKQAKTYRLQYHAYDLVSPKPFAQRLDELRSIHLGECASVVDTWHFSEMASLSRGLNEAREEGYEGLILRVGKAGYEDDKRSTSLLKVKKFFDAEFKVTDITLSERGSTMLHYNAPGGPSKIVAPGTQEDKMHVFYNRETYIGKFVTIEYAELTKDKMLFHAVATQWCTAEMK